jgi:hypothetical protein
MGAGFVQRLQPPDLHQRRPLALVRHSAEGAWRPAHTTSQCPGNAGRNASRKQACKGSSRAAGRPVPVLDEWDLPRLTNNVAFQTRMHMPAKVRLFITRWSNDFTSMTMSASGPREREASSSLRSSTEVRRWCT